MCGRVRLSTLFDRVSARSGIAFPIPPELSTPNLSLSLRRRISSIARQLCQRLPDSTVCLLARRRPARLALRRRGVGVLLGPGPASPDSHGGVIARLTAHLLQSVTMAIGTDRYCSPSAQHHGWQRSPLAAHRVAPGDQTICLAVVLRGHRQVDVVDQVDQFWDLRVSNLNNA